MKSCPRLIETGLDVVVVELEVEEELGVEVDEGLVEDATGDEDVELDVLDVDVDDTDINCDVEDDMLLEAEDDWELEAGHNGTVEDLEQWLGTVKHCELQKIGVLSVIFHFGTSVKPSLLMSAAKK